MSKDDRPTREHEEAASRRRFLKRAAGGAIAVAAVPAVAYAAGESKTGDPGQYDAIVVGGGFAGVTAARDLSRRGHRTLLLEARPRLGGRTFTTRFAGHDLDVGGTWFGSSQPFIWSEMIRYGVPLAESAAARAEQAIWFDGAKRMVGTQEQYAAIYEPAALAFYEPARRVLPRPYDPLFAKDQFGDLDRRNAADMIDSLDLTPVQKALMYSFCAINCHNFTRESSYLDQLRWFALGDFNLWNLWDNLSKYRFAGGTKALLDRIQADSLAETRLGEPVKSIAQNASGVTVRTQRGDAYSARHVVLALPLNCLADIAFEPSISQLKLETSRRHHTGSGTKVYAKIRQKQPVFFGHGVERMPLCFAWTEYDDADAQLLCGFGASPELLDINDDHAVEAAMQSYMPGATLDSAFGYDWNSDPFSKGTWCMYRPGVLSGSLAELQRSEGRIHFAGADVANGWRGFIDGAIESGITSARRVDEQLKQG